MITGDRLSSPADLAEFFGVSVDKVMEWRRVNAWPFVKVGRTIRFTQAQVEEIVARHTEEPKTDQPVTGIPGQTARSAARAS